MRTKTKLYNVLFPFWMLLLFPQLWIIVIPGNFAIDSMVLLIGMYWFKVSEKKEFYKKNILKIFLFGMLADIIGSAYMLMMMLGFQVGKMGDELYLTLPALAISAICIFVFHYFITFRRLEMGLRWKLALLFAMITAPYTFLVPSGWLYR